MNNKVLIILALLLISCVGLLSIRKPVRTERFNSNIQNQNPREHERSENITEEVQQLNEDINKLENIDPDVQPIRVTVTRETEPDKPKEQKAGKLSEVDPEQWQRLADEPLVRQRVEQLINRRATDPGLNPEPSAGNERAKQGRDLRPVDAK